MQAIREYLVRVTAAALLCGVAGKLLPGGSVGAVLKMICGILMALLVVNPVLKLELSELTDFADRITMEADDAVAEGEQQAQTALCEGIIVQTRAYIQDKANELGAELLVEVELTNDQIPVPCGVTLQGQISPYAKSVLSDYLEKSLGIRAEAQTWIS